jgi:hypothetical protein
MIVMKPTDRVIFPKQQHIEIQTIRMTFTIYGLQNGWFIMGIQLIKMDDLGVPPIFGYLHLT